MIVTYPRSGTTWLQMILLMKQHEAKFDPALEMLWESGTQLNSFLRLGRVGQGARELTKAQSSRFDQVLGGYAGLSDVSLRGVTSYSLV